VREARLADPATLDARAVREARAADIPALARLLVELYAFELPGMLHGDIGRQAELARRLLASAPLDGRYVLERDERIVGMGALATREHPRPETPARVLLAAPRVLGWLDGTRTLAGALRGIAGMTGPPAPADGHIHSVVVAGSERGRGAGGDILRHLEQEAARLGKRRAILQVITSNTGARAFYRAAGYAEAPARPPRLVDRIGYPTVTMFRELR
jgi:ribosomal protein S18 acetylase RimI-like enzyme